MRVRVEEGSARYHTGVESIAAALNLEKRFPLHGRKKFCQRYWYCFIFKLSLETLVTD